MAPNNQQQIGRIQKLMNETHQAALRLKQTLLNLTRLNQKRRAEINKLKPPPVGGPTRMYDSVDVSTVPLNAQAVAGYVGGSWPTYLPLVQAFPKAKHLSIAIAASEDADCLDIETGDATPDEAPGWVRRQWARGVKRPCLYANLSTMPAVEAALAGIPRTRYRLWVAQYLIPRRPHLPAGFDACQYDDQALGRNLDVSLLRSDFFN